MEAQLFAGVRALPPEVLAMIAPGDWVIDVGANVGLVTGEVCRAVGATGAVWAIEPVPWNVARLTQLKNSNDLQQLTVFPVASGTVSGTANLSLPRDGNSGHASFTATWIDGSSVSVQTERIDDLVSSHAPDKPLTFLKLDVEGFEQESLAGAANTIARHQPAILCEFNDIILRDRNSSNRELLSVFEDLGYQPVGGAIPREDMVVDVLLRHRR